MPGSLLNSLVRFFPEQLKINSLSFSCGPKNNTNLSSIELKQDIVSLDSLNKREP
jgi:hypothetical protein